MDLPPFAVVDVETSGLSSRRHRILQVGLVVVNADGEVLDRWSSYVKLRWRFGRVGPTHVHGITRRTLRDAPGVDEVVDELDRRTAGTVITAHNARFDGEFLERAVRRRPDHGLHDRLQRRLCTLRMSRRLDPDRLLSHRLVDVCERYGVELVDAHDALADATATAQVLPHLLRAHDVRTADDLLPFLDRVGVPPSPARQR